MLEGLDKESTGTNLSSSIITLQQSDPQSILKLNQAQDNNRG
jgi:hypothetical protein